MISQKEDAVSDVIGVLLLISIATIALGIVGVQFISQVSVTNLPEVDLSIIWQDDPVTSDVVDYKPYVVFERGEPLFLDSITIRINDEIKKGEKLTIKKSDSNLFVPWDSKTPFNIGDTLKWDDYSVENKPRHISIIFSEAGKEILIKSGKNPFIDN